MGIILQHLLLLKVRPEECPLSPSEFFLFFFFEAATPSQIFAKVDLLQIDNNDGEKKKGDKKDKPYQIPRKLLFILLLSM